MHETAADLLEIVWQGISNEYKSRYRRTIWEQFENTVRASAYTNNLGKFINSLCLKISAQIPGKYAAQVEQILNSGNDKTFLKLFRDETTYIVLMVRVRNQERREAWEAQQDKSSEWPNAFAELEKEISEKGIEE